MKFEVLYEDNHLVIVNKRPGILVQSDKTGDPSLIELVGDYIARKYKKPGKAFIGIPHRLDRPTSGIVILARTSKALERMNRMFKERQVEKTYWAIVEKGPQPESGRLENWVKKNEKKNKSFIYPEHSGGTVQAVLHYKTLKRLDHYSLLEVALETGRHHQIRLQLSNLGCPVKGDVKYGARRANKDQSIHLHARSVRFIHPVRKEELYLKASPPDDPVWNACK